MKASIVEHTATSQRASVRNKLSESFLHSMEFTKFVFKISRLVLISASTGALDMTECDLMKFTRYTNTILNKS